MLEERLVIVSTVCCASIVSVISSSALGNAYHEGLATVPLYVGRGPPVASKMPVAAFVVAGVHECM